MKIEAMGRLRFARAGSMVVLGVALVWCWNLSAKPAQPGQGADEETPVELKVIRQIQTTDYPEGGLRTHVLPAITEKGKVARQLEARRRTAASNADNGSEGGQGGVSFYPGDLSYQGGAVLQATESHSIYVNCGAKCFGKPNQFLKNYGDSNFSHVTDEFVGTNANRRYTVGGSGSVKYPVTGPLGPADFLAIVHASAEVFGTGHGHVHHIFFAPGIDVCANAALTVCYSPDNPATWYFCAFHGYVDFKDIGHVLFTIEPYANVAGCQVGIVPSPNGLLVDSTSNVLSHELTETITDPDLDAWWNTYSGPLGGAEIGDECVQYSFSYPNTSINGTLYEIQPEYSNLEHGCVYRPANQPR
jgi:hypothetical protein